MRVLYRVWQAFKRGTAGLRVRDVTVAKQVLPEDAYALFARMSPADQEHALCVHARVSGGPLALQQAALLHDVGKAWADVRLWHRAIHVMARHRAFRGVPWLFGRSDTGERRALREHAARGAELCAKAGLSESVCQLVACHDGGALLESLSEEQRDLLAALCEADEAC